MSEIDGLLRRDDYQRPRLTHAALEYAALGLRVIPLEGKTPFLERWPERGTCCPHQIIAWFESWPDKNLGVLTGDGLAVVDVDPKNGGRQSFRKLTKGREWPTTATALTGSGGHHYLFRVDPALRIGNSNGLLPGIDIKGEGGQFAVEPSEHPRTKKEYVWLRTPKQGIADAPGWLVKMLVERDQPTAVLRHVKPLASTRDGDEGRLLEDVIARFPVTGQGQRHRQMTRVVGRLLGRGYNPELVESVAASWTGHFHALGVIGTSPVEAVREIRACIMSTLRNENFGSAVDRDHRAAVGRIQLTFGQRALIERGMVTPIGLVQAPSPCNRVTKGHALCRTKNERLFIEALVIYFTYKVAHLAESPPKATNDQLRWPIQDRHGKQWANQTFDREVAKYVTRPRRPATHYELAAQTVVGHPGDPYEYELTGLLALMPPGATESLQRCPTG